ncbi:MAG: response regulator [Gemmatimonadaceae bacterium]|nr:response regulator [Gemmatimonadaceae bacterium]NUQ91768.1 response regulator [Gemmatimonadaceae bacterium]NUS98845.1 response regulator [Gemmatimonadaceae bacterium]
MPRTPTASNVSPSYEESRLVADKYRLLFRNNPVPMWVYANETLRFLAVNDAAVASYGYSREEFLSMSLRDVRPTEDVADLERVAHGLPGRYHKTGEWRHRRRNGEVFPVEITSHSVDWDGCAARLVLITDITERRAAEDAIRESAKLAAIGQLISGVAHELNNPLSAILLFVETLLQEPRSAADTEALTMILDQARRSRAIVRDLLSSARGGQMRRECTDLRDLLERTTRGLSRQVCELGGRLELSIEGLLPRLSLDPSSVTQVVTNLVVNAAQAAGPGGTVRLRARAAAGDVQVVVEDDGPGIPSDVMPRLFEPFFTTKPQGEGTGLGLAVSRGIIEAHHGTLMAENNPGRGARFTITLGASPDSSAPRAAPASELRAQGGARRVLIIDDESSIRLALRRYFTRRDWIVEEAEDGAVALRRLRDADAPEYALIVSDLKMPGLSGIDLYDQIARHRPELVGRIVFSTGDVASSDARAFIERVEAPVLQKPFELKTLDDLIARYLPADR